ncbi:MAG TPA: ATP-binding protein [Opitutaceae bacterium]|nr:ATP-binding protein [Opitutaceae bacterium]
MSVVTSLSRQLRYRRGLGITVRTAWLAWLVTISTLLIFALAIVPQQKRTLLDYLYSKANGVAVSLRDVAASAAVSEDYSSVVDHCVDILKGDPAIDYIVLTRNDGFSLIHDHNGWRASMLPAEWHPPERVTQAGIGDVPLFGRRVYRFSQPFEYSGINWGWIHVGLSLESYDASVAAVYWRTGMLAVICMLVALAATIVYARHLVSPILALQAVVRQVASGDLSARAPTARSDELGQLAMSVNAMTEALLRRDRTLKEANETLERRVADRTRELEHQVVARERAHHALAEAQQHLMELSREAGRAEIATGVLHSVGNALNSVNVSTTLLQDQLGRSQLHALSQAVALLSEHRADLAAYLVRDARGRHIPEFVIEVSAAIASEHAAWRTELDGVSKNVEHIKEIVAMQQSYARVAGLSERLSPHELAQDAIRMHQAAFAGHGIEVVADFQPVPDVVVDKHKVMQIFVTLLSNATWAVDDLPPGQRRITVSVTAQAGRVRFAITDNGIGIAAHNLSRIFQHGFTTRKDGHGFGLHMAALAAAELDGTLAARSDGLRRGSTFVLELPAETPAPSS